jgi:AcrR family transcriptional regulator
VNVDAAATARALARQLLRHLPLPASVGEVAGRAVPAPGLEKRVLDAAARRSAEQGVSATTMSQLARDAEISREWLYRHYRNRNAVLAALALREIQELLEEVAERAVAAGDVVESAVESFTYVVTFAREHPLLRRGVADDLLRLGLVNRVVPQADLDDTVADWADEVASQPPLAVRAAKRTMRLGLDTTFEANTHHVLSELMALFRSKDFGEAVSAHLEKREPTYQGR